MSRDRIVVAVLSYHSNYPLELKFLRVNYCKPASDGRRALAGRLPMSTLYTIVISVLSTL